MKALIIKEFRELRRDRRTLAMLVAMPLLLLIIFGYAANFTVNQLSVAVVGSESSQVVQQMQQHTALRSHFDVNHVDAAQHKQDAIRLLKDDNYDVTFVAERSTHTGSSSASNAAVPATAPNVHVYIDGANLFAAQSTRLVLSQLQQRSTIPLTTTILFNPDLKTSWVMVPAIIGLILTFIGTIITSIGLVREREAGTFEQLAVMPLRPASVVLGKVIPYFILAAIDLAIITVLGCLVFGVPFNGNVGVFALGAAIFLFVVLGIGVLTSSVSQTSGQAVQLAFMTLLPQILLSGMIFPLNAMAAGVRWIGYLLPLTWFTKISQGVMLRDTSFPALWLPFAVLTLLAIVVFGAAVLRLRHDLAPARAGRPSRQDPESQS